VSGELVPITSSPPLAEIGLPTLPEIIAREGEQAGWHFYEFFTANIRNLNTRLAYARAVSRFLTWCEARGIGLKQIRPAVVSTYIEGLLRSPEDGKSPATVKQHLAAIRMLFDWMVLGHILPMNPASSVRGPKYIVKKGKTPVLSAQDARILLDSIDTSHVVGLRDRALIGAMVYSFARVSAVIHMRVEDYYPNGKRWWFRLHEKGGKFHEVPAHHSAEEFMDAYLEAAGIAGEKKTPLFRSTLGKSRQLTKNAMRRQDVFRMIKRRAKEARISARICCHTFRATGITAYLENGGTIEKAQAIAAHESPRTTKLYDRTGDAITLDEIELIRI
jgi:integrase/recombinase XerD